MRCAHCVRLGFATFSPSLRYGENVAYAGNVVRNGNKTLAGRPCPACGGVTLVLDIIHNFCKLICHQKPERSFFINDFQFFLCARCTGIYLPIFLLLFTYPLVEVKYSYKHLFVFLFLSLIINLLTYIEIIDTNIIRFILGSLIGFPTGLILIKSIKILFSKGEEQ